MSDLSDELDYFYNGELFHYLSGSLSPSTFNFFANGEVFSSVEYYAAGVSGSEVSRVYTTGATISLAGDVAGVVGIRTISGETDLNPKIIVITNGDLTQTSSIIISMGVDLTPRGTIKYFGSTTSPLGLSIPGVDLAAVSSPTEGSADIFVGVSLSVSGGAVYSGTSTFIADMDLTADGTLSHITPPDTSYSNEYTQVAQIDHVHQNSNTKLVFLVEEDGVSLDISEATVKKLILTKPDRTSVVLSVGFYTDGKDGKVAYVTSLSDLNIAGYYNYQVFVTIDNQQIYSDVGSFRVYSNILSL